MISKTTRPLYRSSGSVALRHDCLLRAGEPRHLGAESRVCARRPSGSAATTFLTPQWSKAA